MQGAPDAIATCPMEPLATATKERALGRARAPGTIRAATAIAMVATACLHSTPVIAMGGTLVGVSPVPNPTHHLTRASTNDRTRLHRDPACEPPTPPLPPKTL